MALATWDGVCTGGLGPGFRPRGSLAASKNSVAVPTGQMTLTLIPLPFSSRRSDSESPMRANLLAQYAPERGMPRFPTMDETLMICPLPCLRMLGSGRALPPDAAGEASPRALLTSQAPLTV